MPAASTPTPRLFPSALRSAGLSNTTPYQWVVKPVNGKPTISDSLNERNTIIISGP